MKKIFIILSIASAIICISSCAAANKAVEIDREVKKESRDYAMEKSREGFFAIGTGSQHSIYYNYLLDKKEVNPPVEFNASAEGSERLVESKAEHDIMGKYAEYIMPTNIKSRTVSELGEINGENFDSFYTAYKMKVSANVSMSSLRFIKLKKRLDDGRYRCEVYAFEYPSAYRKRMNALYEAAKESGLAHEYADEIARWIDEP